MAYLCVLRWGSYVSLLQFHIKSDLKTMFSVGPEEAMPVSIEARHGPRRALIGSREADVRAGLRLIAHLSTGREHVHT